MRRYKLTYFISEGLKGFFRHGAMSWASIFILASALLITGSFSLLIVNINYNIDQIDDFNDIVVYAELGADKAKIDSIENEIRNIKQVSNVTFVSKEESLKIEKQRYDEEYAHLFDTYGSDNNPLPDSFRVEYENANDVDVLVYNLQNIDGVDKVKNRKDIADNINKVKSVILLVSTFLAATLLVVSVSVIINTIKIAVKAREEEIQIMRYIGATNFFITMPFVIEGIVIGLISSLISLAVQWYSYIYITNEIIADYGIVEYIPFTNLSIYVIPAYILAGLLLSVVGTAIFMRRYLKA